MPTPKFNLATLSIASPCSADWATMQGDARARFCASCEKHVYDFAEMTEEEGIALIVATEGKFCGRFSQRKDGTLITKDCPVGWARKIYRRCAYAVLAACLLLLSVVWIRTRPEGQSPMFDRINEWYELAMEKIGWRTIVTANLGKIRVSQEELKRLEQEMREVVESLK